MLDEIFSYREMCEQENAQTLQRGMNFRMRPGYSVVLMSRRANAPYHDRVHEDGITIEYEGHDEPRTATTPVPKHLDQPRLTLRGALTQNGRFIEAVELYKSGKSKPEVVKVYEKILPGVWSLKGFFDLLDFHVRHDGKRNTYIFVLRLSEDQHYKNHTHIDLKHTRLIPSEVKKEVWKRDAGKCVVCGSNTNLHFDHDLPFSKGGTSLTANNIKLLCAKHNLQKSAKIE
jgi:hypothetical protein